MTVIKIEKRQIKEAASDVRSWIEDAVGDMANYTDHHMMDKKWRVKLAQAKRDGVTDLRGWLADEYYNDKDTLADLCGDKIHDETTIICGRKDRDQFDRIYIAICEEMKTMSHPQLVRALDELIAFHKKEESS